MFLMLLQLKQDALVKKAWFALTRNKEVKVDELRNLLRYLAHKSSKLLDHVVNYVDGNVRELPQCANCIFFFVGRHALTNRLAILSTMIFYRCQSGRQNQR